MSREKILGNLTNFGLRNCVPNGIEQRENLSVTIIYLENLKFSPGSPGYGDTLIEIKSAFLSCRTKPREKLGLPSEARQKILDF